MVFWGGPPNAWNRRIERLGGRCDQEGQCAMALEEIAEIAWGIFSGTGRTPMQPPKKMFTPNFRP